MNYSHVFGSVFSKLTVVGQTGIKDRLICACECGAKKEARLSHLKSGTIKSCGCLLKSVPKQVHGKHFRSREPEYKVWCSMIDRCTKETHHAYKSYGGRGICVAGSWSGVHGYVNFFNDMGKRPEGGTLDRVDNNGPYSPDNCRWADMKAQGRNRRTNVMLTHRDQTFTVMEWGEKVGLMENTIYERLRRGWTVEKT